MADKHISDNTQIYTHTFLSHIWIIYIGINKTIRFNNDS